MIREGLLEEKESIIEIKDLNISDLFREKKQLLEKISSLENAQLHQATERIPPKPQESQEGNTEENILEYKRKFNSLQVMYEEKIKNIEIGYEKEIADLEQKVKKYSVSSNVNELAEMRRKIEYFEETVASLKAEIHSKNSEIELLRRENVNKDEMIEQQLRQIQGNSYTGIISQYQSPDDQRSEDDEKIKNLEGEILNLHRIIEGELSERKNFNHDQCQQT